MPNLFKMLIKICQNRHGFFFFFCSLCNQVWLRQMLTSNSTWANAVTCTSFVDIVSSVAEACSLRAFTSCCRASRRSALKLLYQLRGSSPLKGGRLLGWALKKKKNRLWNKRSCRNKNFTIFWHVQRNEDSQRQLHLGRASQQRWNVWSHLASVWCLG